MDITIDTTHPLNDRDRAILAALISIGPDAPPAPPAPAAHTHEGPRPGSAQALVAGIASPRKPDGAIADARRPVAQQPGVSFTESTAEDETTAG